MKELEEILLGGMFRPTEQNCPTREGELIGSLDKIHGIPNPRVGMRVYVENTGKEYIIKSLKDKTIGGVNVPNAAVDKFEEVVNREDVQEIFNEIATESINRLNADNTIKASALKLEQSVNTTTNKVTIKGYSVDAKKEYSFDIPSATKEKAGVMSAEDKKKLDAAGNGATKITWGSASNMNDFRTAGVYEIYGERTNLSDNLPILNSNPGHSIAGRLTVVASTLQPANNEICVTQFLMLSNRLGGDGNMYVRTYNQNNSPFMNGWSPWQKQIGMVETLINGDDVTVGQEIFSQGSGGKIGNGINGMIDNGMYSGIYIDNLSYTGTNIIYYLSAQPTFVETFVLIVINDYAASDKAGLPRHITQLKYAVDAITGQSTVKKRVGTGDKNISWGDWEDIGGGSNEVDVTDAVKAYGLPTLIEQGYAKEGVTYVAHILNGDLSGKTIVLDKQGKLVDFFKSKYVLSPAGATIKFNYSLLKGHEGYNSDLRVVSGTLLLDYGKYEFYINIDLDVVKVSADMTTL